MSCPHGNGEPGWCSQCQGAIPRVVTKVVDGIYAVGDEIVDRTGLLGPAFQKQAGYGTVATGKKPQCYYCRKVGHKESECRDKRNNNRAAAARKAG